MYNDAVMSASKKGKSKTIISKVVIYIILVLYAAIILFPFAIVIITSFKTWQESRDPIFKLFPEDGYVLDGYKFAFSFGIDQLGMDMPMLVKGFLNTLIYIIPPTFLGLFTSSLAAYAFAKLRFRAKNLMYGVLLATMMIPGTITIPSTYSVYSMLDLNQSPFPLMVPGMFGAAACVFFMRQYFSGIPDSVVEAAKIDGVGYFGIFIKIIVPLAVPALIAQGLLGFIGGYNDYFGPLIYLKDYEQFNLQLVLQFINMAEGEKGPSNVMASTIVALLPTIAVYLIAQDFFIEGIAASGIKG